MQKVRALFTRYRELVVYVLAGILTTAVNYVTYAVLTVFCGLDINLSNVIAWVVAVAVAFFTNKAFVFQNKDWSPAVTLREAGLFVGSRLLSGVVSIGLLPLLMKLGIDQSFLGIPGFVAKFLAEGVALVLSYFLSKYVVFRKAPSSGDGPQ